LRWGREEACFLKGEMFSESENQRISPLQFVIWYSDIFQSTASLDRKVDRNADNHQRTITNIDERETALQGTGGIPRNIREQRSSYPPFGIQ
jgi:hypothetical protein